MKINELHKNLAAKRAEIANLEKEMQKFGALSREQQIAVLLHDYLCPKCNGKDDPYNRSQPCRWPNYLSSDSGWTQGPQAEFLKRAEKIVRETNLGTQEISWLLQVGLGIEPVGAFATVPMKTKKVANPLGYSLQPARQGGAHENQ